MTKHEDLIARYDRTQEAAGEALRAAVVRWNAIGDQLDKDRSGQLTLPLKKEH